MGRGPKSVNGYARWGSARIGGRAPLCRWLIEDLVVDVMPDRERVLGFTNRWYRQVKKQSEERTLPKDIRIRAVTAPLFVATKIEAFRPRGRGDFVASQDLEDIIAVVDGRPALVDEVKRAPAQVRRFLAGTMKQWLDDPDFLVAVPGHLPGDVASQARASVVLERLRSMAAAGPAPRPRAGGRRRG